MTCPTPRKRRYETRAEARKWVKRGGSARVGLKNEARGKNRLRPYLCPGCGFWHLGHLAHDIIHGIVTRDVMNKHG